MIAAATNSIKRRCSTVSFSIMSDAAWAPGVETRDAWRAWAENPFRFNKNSEPLLSAMPPMQRRRVSFLGRMALEVAYSCLGDRRDVPLVFCSRHGEVSRSVDLLCDLASGELLSPASFGLSVHNAIAGMFSIARGDHANTIALSAGSCSIESALIEACGLLADGEKAVLLVVYDCPLPSIYANFQTDSEQPFAWAWLIEVPRDDVISLSWSAMSEDAGEVEKDELAPGLQVLRFHLRRDRCMERVFGKQKWQWSRNA